ncbi:MAG: DUF488 domain-containing protein [Pirellulales bacterium]|nr:DUF488 domain-containing protein [Pirellulales bacterium]
MEIHTIGFTKKSAAEFFESLRRAGIRRLIDVRLNNTSQLASFAKRDDLRYFLREICAADYRHEPPLAPTQELLDAYKHKQIDWNEYARRYRALLLSRQAETAVDRRWFDVPAVLLCSEPTAEHCHRRLAAEYLAEHWEGVSVVHL